MSQSPIRDKMPSTAALGNYRKGWQQLYQLLQSGRSLSGRERNCCFLNLGSTKKFADISAISGIDFADDGRALAIVDWDHDGDLDIWLTNRTAPRLRFLRNDSPHGNHFLAVRLVGTECNRDAIGARVELHLGGSHPRRLIQTVRAGEGFLSQSSKWVHFGLGAADQIDRLVIRWPNSPRSEELTGLTADRRYKIVQGSNRAHVISAARPEIALDNAQTPVLPSAETQRAVVCGRIPLPPMAYRGPDGRSRKLSSQGGPLLVNLWATWCQPCVLELSQFSRNQTRIREVELEVLALSVDELASRETSDADTVVRGESSPSVAEMLQGLKYPFQWGHAQLETLTGLEHLQASLFDDARPFPIPTSFLLDDQGCVVAIYRGGLEIDRLLDDVALLDADARAVRQASTPFSGTWLTDPPPPKPMGLARSLEQRDPELAAEYLRRVIELRKSGKRSDYWSDDASLAGSYLALATIELGQGTAEAALENLRNCVRYDSQNFTAYANLGSAYFRLRKWAQAESSFTKAHHIQTKNVNVLVNRGLTRLQLNRASDAKGDFAAALSLDHTDARARYNLARSELVTGNDRVAVQHLESLLDRAPNLWEVQNDLAWILATSADASVRDGARAVELAAKVCQRTGSTNAMTLRTLAAAQAEVGRFQAGIETVREAINVANAQNNSTLARDLETMLQSLSQGKPIRRVKIAQQTD